jgi:heme-degrading monooxygenase HmoA
VSGGDGVVSVLELPVLAGCEQAVIAFYGEREVFEHARRSGGFRAGRLLEPSEQGTPFLVIAEWDDAEAYQRWLDNPVRDELGRGLAPLLDGVAADSAPTRGGVYRQVGLWTPIVPGRSSPDHPREAGP